MKVPKLKRRSRRSVFGAQTNTGLERTQNITNLEKSTHISAVERLKYVYEHSDQIVINDELLFLVAAHSWSLYRVCQLHKLSFNKVKLKQYASCIKRELVNNYKDITTDVTFYVTVEKIYVFENNEDSCGLKIEVFLCIDEDTRKLKYRGLLLSWDEYNLDDITFLPLLLNYGPSNIAMNVIRVVENIFDTIIRPLHISEQDIMWLSALLNDSDSETSDAYYNYHMPQSPKNIITVSIPYKIVRKLWTKIHQPNSEDASIDEINLFHKKLQTQFTITYGINFELLKLFKFDIQGVTLSSDGKLRIRSTQTIGKVLNFINEICILLDSHYSITMSAQIFNNNS